MIICTFEDGNKAIPGLRHVTVCALAYNVQGQVLLVKRSKKYSRPNLYTLPGGFLDRDLTTDQAVLKELQEEAGVTGEVVTLFHINDNPHRPYEDRQNVDVIYLVRVVGGEFVENEETISAEWFGENTLPSEEMFAFDHRKVLMKFFVYQKEKFALPLVGEIID